MARTRTFIDSGVLIDAARGIAPLSEAALAVLGDPARILVSSELVRLEVVPKAKFHQRREEVELYEAFFASLGKARLIRVSRQLVAQALTETAKAGLGPIDALHVAAAKHSRCNELITTEKSDKPLFRVSGLSVRTIR